MECYIKRLKIKNFQSHKNTDIELLPGLNILVGESDQGKSSVIRALRWLFYNEPSGTGFIREGETYCEVTVEMNSGVVISRIRDARINRYLIKYPDGSEDKFDSVGNQVPPEVKRELGITSLNYGEKSLDINIAYQLDSPFLFDKSGPDKAKIIGSIADLHIIDAAQQELLRDIKSQQSKHSELEKEITGFKAELDMYEDLDSQKQLAAQINQLLSAADEKRKEKNYFEEIKSRWDRIQNEIDINSAKLERLKNIEVAEDYYRNSCERYNLFKKLTDININMKKTVENITFCEQKLEKLKSLEDLQKIKKDLENLSYNYKELCNIEKRQKEIEENLKRINLTIEHTEKLDEIEKMIDLLREKRNQGSEMQKIKKEMARMKEGISKAEMIINKTANVPELEELQIKITVNLDKYQKLQEIKQRYDRVVAERNKVLKHLNRLEEEYEDMLKKYITILQEIERCPTCNSKITGDVVKEIMNKMSL
ncbi:AAA family ATPase [Thermosyntropha sp.]|uniref:AAA family ATPase n=1 Tax=Thermosyntropha sp. TaxID=2740820 RepID=UPI0025E6088E|nr:AAA family ATPase [Thermosyntropha sp.]MBO8158358.1 AAA family ATPase [Thermosyntropha sp.]